MGDIQTLQKQIMEKVQATGDQQVQALQAELSSKMESFQAKLQEQFQTSQTTFRIQQERQLEIKKQSLVNNLRNQRLSKKQDLLRGLIQQVVTKVNDMGPEKFEELIRHVIGKVQKDAPFTLQMGEKSWNNLSEAARQSLRADFPQMELQAQGIKEKSGFMVTQAGINYNYIFEDVIAELTPQLLIELEKQLKV